METFTSATLSANRITVFGIFFSIYSSNLKEISSNLM